MMGFPATCRTPAAEVIANRNSISGQWRLSISLLKNGRDIIFFIPNI